MLGNYKYSVDDKGRITIPAKFRNELGSVIYVTRDFDNVLTIRTQKQFEDFKKILLSQNSFSKNARLLQRSIIGNTFELEFDKQGRILIPKLLLESVNIVNEVVIVASGNRIEIISLSEWEKINDEMYDNGLLEKAAEKLYED